MTYKDQDGKNMDYKITKWLNHPMTLTLPHMSIRLATNPTEKIP